METKKKEKEDYVGKFDFVGSVVIEAVKYCLGVYIVFHEKVERYSRYLVGIFALIFYGCFLRKEDNFDLILIYILVVCCSLWTFEEKSENDA